MTSSITLTTVGVSGSFPGPYSAASCYVVTTHDGDKEYNLVLDLGSGSVGPLQRVLSYTSIDAVFLSHLHPDHCLDVTALYVQRKFDPAHFGSGTTLPKLPVYGPAGTSARLEAAHLTPGATPAHNELEEVFDFFDLAPGVAHRVGPLTVRSFLVNHPVEAYALRIEHTDGTLLTYSGDSDTCDGLTQAARDADLFVCEAAFEDGRDEVRGIHMTGSRAGETARAAGAKRLLLTHIPPWTNTDKILADATRTYGAQPEVAHPLQTYAVSRTPNS